MCIRDSKDVGDPYTGRGGGLEHTVNVTLRIDHQRDLAVVGEVGAIAQGRGLDGNNGDHAARSFQDEFTVCGTDRAWKVRVRGRRVCWASGGVGAAAHVLAGLTNVDDDRA